MVVFEFKCKDILTTRAARKGMEIRMAVFGQHPIAVVMLLTVVERLVCECSGGIQLIYKCRIEGIGDRVNLIVNYVDFNEIELTNDLSTLQPAEDVSRKDA